MKKILIISSIFFSFFLFRTNAKALEEVKNVGGDVVYTYASAGQISGSSGFWVWGNKVTTRNNVFTLRSPSSSTYYYIDSVEITLRIHANEWVPGKKYVVSWFFTTAQNGIFNSDDYSCFALNGGTSGDSTCNISGSSNGLLAVATVYANNSANSDIFIRVTSKYPVTSNQKYELLTQVPQYSNLFYDVDLNIVGQIFAGYYYNPATDIIIDQNNQTNKELNDINNTLNDDTPPSADISGLGNVQGLLKPGPVDSLLNIPTEFLSVVVSSLGGQCKPLSGKWVFDQTLTYPCFDEIFWDEVEDETLMKFLELIPSSLILIGYFKHLYKKVERATSMETNSDDEWGVI